MNNLNSILIILLVYCMSVSIKCEYSLHVNVKNLPFQQMKILWRQSDFPFLYLTYESALKNQPSQTVPFVLNCSGSGKIAFWMNSVNEDDETAVRPILCSTDPPDIFGDMTFMRIVTDVRFVDIDLLRRSPRLQVNRMTIHCKRSSNGTSIKERMSQQEITMKQNSLHMKEPDWDPCHIRIIRPIFNSMAVKAARRQSQALTKPPHPTLIHISAKETGFSVKALVPMQPAFVKNPILGCLIQISIPNEKCILTTLWSRAKGKLETIRPVVQSLMDSCEKEIPPAVREENGGIVFFTFNQLQPETSYTITAYSINDGAYRSSKASTVSTKKPQVIQMVEKETKSTSITLSIPKRTYPVTLLVMDQAGQVKQIVVNETSDSVTIDGLVPAEEYTITWKRPIGNDIYEHKIPMKLRTKPPANIQLVATHIDHSSVTMKIVGGYKEAIRVKITSDPPGTPEIFFLKPPEEEFRISDLAYNTNYSITLEQETVNNTWFTQPDKFIITTSILPMANVSEYGSSTSTSFQLQWRSKISTNIKISVSTSNKLIWQQVVNVSASSKVEVNGLTPHSVYTVSWEQQVNSSWIQNPQQFTIQTKSSPSSEPQTISVQDVTNISAVMKWNKPQTPNGIITDYCIVCYSTNSLSKEECESSRNETSQSGHVSNLNPFTSYSCRVYAKNDAGNGLFSSAVNFTTEESISEKVEDLLVNEMSNDQLQVHWNPPTRSNGRIQHYIVLLYQQMSNISENKMNCVECRIISFSSERNSSSSAQQFREVEISGVDNFNSSECWSVPVEQTWMKEKNQRYTVTFRGFPSFNNYSVQVLPVNKAGVGRLSVANNKKEKKNSMEPLVAGASILFLLLALLIMAILYVVLRHRMKQRGTQRKLSATASPLLVKQNTVYSLPIPKKRLREYVEAMDEDRNAEFHELMKILKVDSVNGDVNPVITSNHDHNQQPRNNVHVVQNPLWKNLPGGADYMNADWIPMDDKEYIPPLANGDVVGDEKKTPSPILWIAAQGPHGILCANFWQMIWTNNTDFIVMLNSDDMIDICCDQYWPDSISEPAEQGDFQIILKHEKLQRVYALRTLEVCHIVTNERRLVHQLQYLNEMDHEMSSVKAFHYFMEHFETLENIYRSGKVSAILIHCTTGTGRTGAFLAIVKLLSVLQMKDEENIDVLGTIVALREHRENLVESQEQLEFIFHYLLFFYENIVDTKQKDTSVTMNESV